MGPHYYTSNMILTIHSGASFLVAPEAKRCIAGFFSLQQPHHTSTQNAPILVECKTLKHMIISAVECKNAAAFHNVQQAIPIQYILHQIGYPQPATSLLVDNTTTQRFINNMIIRKI